MRLKKIELRNFKKFLKKEVFEFTDADGEVSDITLILGNNGSGKTSLLQAIVLLTASACQVKLKVKFDGRKMDWAGFNHRHVQSGSLPAAIKGTYLFKKEEIDATIDYVHQLQEQGLPHLIVPSNEEIATINFDFEKWTINENDYKNNGQFRGYKYVDLLSRVVKNNYSLLGKVGNVFWYTEQRTSYSLSNLLDTDAPKLDWIRNFLANTYAYHVAVADQKREIEKGQFDFYDALHTLYKKVFPGRKFIGATPRFDVFEKAKAPEFFLSDGISQYEISEMSAGERAIFPILMDFARWNINHSLIIIDEIELHLHPPLQQSLIRALPKLGVNNQFIITSHSNTVASMFEEENIIRL